MKKHIPTILGIIVAVSIAMFLTTVIAGASSIISSDRALFMCSVDTIECPPVKFVPLAKPLQIKLLPATATTSTISSDEIRMKQLVELVKQLQELLRLLQAERGV